MVAADPKADILILIIVAINTMAMAIITIPGGHDRKVQPAAINIAYGGRWNEVSWSMFMLRPKQ